MPPIPLAPLQPINSGDQDPERAGRSYRSRRAGRLVRAARYLSSPLSNWAGVGSIRNSASWIGDTVKDVRVATRRDPRFRLFPTGEFDFESTAFLFEISVSDLKHRLAARQRQTAFMAYICFALSLASSVTWIGGIFAPTDGGSVLLTANAIGFGVICFLGAFYQSLVNFQLRAGRAAKWKEFLLADRGFWPIP